MDEYAEARRSVYDDLHTKDIVRPVTHKASDRPPCSVDEALLMYDILEARMVRLMLGIQLVCQKQPTAYRNEVLVALTKRQLKWINVQQMYLNSAANFLVLQGNASDLRVKKHQKYLDFRRELGIYQLQMFKAKLASE